MSDQTTPLGKELEQTKQITKDLDTCMSSVVNALASCDSNTIKALAIPHITHTSTKSEFSLATFEELLVEEFPYVKTMWISGTILDYLVANCKEFYTSLDLNSKYTIILSGWFGTYKGIKIYTDAPYAGENRCMEAGEFYLFRTQGASFSENVVLSIFNKQGIIKGNLIGKL